MVWALFVILVDGNGGFQGQAIDTRLRYDTVEECAAEGMTAFRKERGLQRTHQQT